MSGQAHATSKDTSEGTSEFVSLSYQLLGDVVSSFYETAGLRARRLSVEPTSGRRVDVEEAASIGFVSDHVRGTLLVVPTHELLVRSHPLTDRCEGANGELRDWLGETANQLLGRLRNQLVPYDVNLLSDTPLLLTGTVRIGGMRRVTSLLEFDVEGSKLRLWWDIQVDPELQLKSGGETAHEEGELQLF